MKKQFIFSILSAIVIIIGTIMIWSVNPMEFKSIKEKNKIRVDIQGAVQDSKSQLVSSGTSVLDIIKKAHPKESIDWDLIDKVEKVYEDMELMVPYKKGLAPKFKVKDGLTDKQIDSLLVNKNIKKALKELFKNNKNVTWNDIDNIPGVGEKVLLILRNQLEL